MKHEKSWKNVSFVWQKKIFVSWEQVNYACLVFSPTTKSSSNDFKTQSISIQIQTNFIEIQMMENKFYVIPKWIQNPFQINFQSSSNNFKSVQIHLKLIFETFKNFQKFEKQKSFNHDSLFHWHALNSRIFYLSKQNWFFTSFHD